MKTRTERVLIWGAFALGGALALAAAAPVIGIGLAFLPGLGCFFSFGWLFC